MLGDRLTAGRRVLVPLIKVRILVPQPPCYRPFRRFCKIIVFLNFRFYHLFTTSMKFKSLVLTPFRELALDCLKLFFC
jgi:hypothetical protein